MTRSKNSSLLSSPLRQMALRPNSPACGAVHEQTWQVRRAFQNCLKSNRYLNHAQSPLIWVVYPNNRSASAPPALAARTDLAGHGIPKWSQAGKRPVRKAFSDHTMALSSGSMVTVLMTTLERNTAMGCERSFRFEINISISNLAWDSAKVQFKFIL